MTEQAATLEADWTPLAEAMSALAGHCDGAQAPDRQGFNAGDVPLGHYLAELPAADYDETAAAAAWQLARTYQQQLAGYGIEFAELPVPPTPETAVRDQMTERRHAAARAAEFAAASFCRAGNDNGRSVFVLGFPYDAAMVAEARVIPGRTFRKQFAGRTNVNLYPVSAAPAVAEFCAKHGITLSPGAADLVANPPTPAPERPKAPNISFSRDGADIEIVFDAFPTPAQRQAVKTIPGREWNETRKIWTAPNRRRALLVLPGVADTAGLTMTGDVAKAACAELERANWNRRASAALTPTGTTAEVPGLHGALQDHQAAGLEFIAANRRVLVGDVMGLGKTLLSLAALARDGAFPAVVVCKTSLRLNWQAEVAKFFPDLRTFVASGWAPTPIPADTDVIVIGFDVLKATYEEQYTDERGKKQRRTVPGWLPALMEREPCALVLDESHYGKEADAERSQAMEALGKSVASRDGLVLALTGTAAINRPLELVQQLKILGRAQEFGADWEFKNRYCGPVRTGFGVDYSGSSNERELHRLLREYGIYLRRGKEALDLPALDIRPVVLDDDELDPKAMAAYRKAERNFLAAVLARASERGVDLTDAEQRRDFVDAIMSAKVLVELNLLRELAGRTKASAVTARVHALVETGEKVMIAAHHSGAISTYMTELGNLRIQGGQSTSSVEADKHAFQTLDVEAAPVITVSTTAGGVGHTLTAAAHGVMAELPWTWAEIDQMAARLHRIGQQRPVTFQIALAPGTVDAHMWQTVTAKREITGAILDGERHAALDRQAFTDVLDRLLAERLDEACDRAA